MSHSAPNENHRMPFIRTLLLETVFTYLTPCSGISCGTTQIFHVMRRRSVGLLTALFCGAQRVSSQMTRLTAR
jgi:hypothetical protein